MGGRLQWALGSHVAQAVGDVRLAFRVRASVPQGHMGLLCAFLCLKKQSAHTWVSKVSCVKMACTKNPHPPPTPKKPLSLPFLPKKPPAHFLPKKNPVRFGVFFW